MRRLPALLLAALALGACWRAEARVIRVGPGGDFTLPSQAAAAAVDGDIVEIQAGAYPGDAAVWRANGLTLRGVGEGRARLLSRGATAEGKAIWVIKGRDTRVEGIEFAGARVPDGNGAGIRQEGANLVVSRCLFRNNENGILAGPNPESDILVEYSEFAHNGHGDGRTHNLYIGAVRRFTLRFSYSHHARSGHLVKSRAAENHLLYNRLADEEDGYSSYLIDLPAGGLAFVVGNVLHQGTLAENGTMVSYGAEQILHGDNRLFVVHNTWVNARRTGCRLLSVNHTTEPAWMLNNAFTQCDVVEGPHQGRGNVSAPAKAYRDLAAYDFRPRAGSPVIDKGAPLAGLVPDAALPEREYIHPLADQPRQNRGRPDAGAYEYAAR
ncbi:MAG TPA: hypothetical protein PK437_00215 [Thiobacillaceae bacterium]|nr:hypothetical protein [Thiobacillaceae bacterium]